MQLNQNDVTPKDVIDYFRSSPHLRGYANDLERQLKHQGLLDDDLGTDIGSVEAQSVPIPTAEASRPDGEKPAPAGGSTRPHGNWGQDIEAGSGSESPQMGKKTLEVSEPESPHESVSMGLMDRFMAVIDALIGLERRVKRGYLEMEQLLDAGLTDASLHWRKDARGERTILELLHPTGSPYETQNGRRREYIGKDPQKIAEAKARVDRYHQYQMLQQKVRSDESELVTIKHRIDALEMMALAVQQELPGAW